MALPGRILPFVLLGACVRAAPATCPQAAAPAAAPSAPAPAFGWADPDALTQPDPLALYGMQWLLQAGDGAGATPLSSALHPFTLGRWECAVSAEKAEDELGSSFVRVARTRKLACTHSTGLTLETQLSCGFRLPALPADGSPARARRETRLGLAEAPALLLACEPVAVERVALVRGEQQLGDVCLAEQQVRPCAAPTPGP